MAEPIDEGQDEEFSGVFTDIFPADWAADPDFCQYLTQLRKVSIDLLKIHFPFWTWMKTVITGYLDKNLFQASTQSTAVPKVLAMTRSDNF